MNRSVAAMKEWIRKCIKPRREAAHLATGRWGENQAVRYLKSRNYKIIEQRLRVGRHDELDIIAECGGVQVFVEVKTRKDERFGRPFSAVTREKRKRLSRAAINYLKRKKLTPDFIRFDVVEVIGEPEGSSPEIRHIENAFQLDPAVRLWW